MIADAQDTVSEKKKEIQAASAKSLAGLKEEISQTFKKEKEKIIKKIRPKSGEDAANSENA